MIWRNEMHKFIPKVMWNLFVYTFFLFLPFDHWSIGGLHRFPSKIYKHKLILARKSKHISYFDALNEMAATCTSTAPISAALVKRRTLCFIFTTITSLIACERVQRAAKEKQKMKRNTNSLFVQSFIISSTFNLLSAFYF